MIGIDGSGGGGQVVRTAVALSAVSGEPVRVENVRGGRPEPGLRPQHLAAVEAAASLCDATVDGAERDSETLVFEPGDVRADDVQVDIGTAGSVALVLDTLVPLAVALDEPATVTVTGGTDVQWAPPIDYLRRVKLPLLADVGLDASLSVAGRGFYPKGGGEATLTLGPSSPSPLDLTERGPLRRLEVYSVAEDSLESADVAERQAAAAVDGAVEHVGEDVATAMEATYVESPCVGSSVVVVPVYDESRAGFSAFGEAGKPSEDVAAEAVAEFEQFHDVPAAIDRHLADQLQVFLALAGGTVVATEVTRHVQTNRDVLAAFGYDLWVEERGEDGVRIEG